MVGIEAENDPQAESQHHQQEHQGRAHIDGSAGQRALGRAFDPSVKATVPEIVGDATGTAHGQSTQHDLGQQHWGWWGGGRQPKGPTCGNQQNQTARRFVPAQQFKPRPEALMQAVHGPWNFAEP